MSASYYMPWGEGTEQIDGHHFIGAEILGYYGIFVLSGGAYYGIEREKLLGTIGVGIGF